VTNGQARAVDLMVAGLATYLERDLGERLDWFSSPVIMSISVRRCASTSSSTPHVSA